jgi:Zn-dependent peptidase ImmA (M78 family)/DNA-binding XRE family transcriptional regulator
MRIGTPGFQPERLIEARDSRGLTQVALAELVNRQSSSISRWETGIHPPESEVLEALGKALNVPVAFFMRPVQNHGHAPLFFRSMASTTQIIRKRTEVRLRWAQDISLKLQESIDLPAVNVPHLEVNDYREIRDEDIERAANQCRKRWDLGSGPISDLLLALENAGIIVVKEEVGTVKMDGLSNWSSADDRPYMLIAKDKDTCVRSRMDAAHELGHLVLHRGLKPKTLNNGADFKEIERQAFYFAGAFLMPEESFASEIWSPSLNAFVSLKERWKTSVGAMIMRCRVLEIIGEDHERRIWKYYSAKGWRKSEPLDDSFIPEEPRLLSRSVQLLIDEGLFTHAELLNDFLLHAQDIESLCNLPTGYMTARKAEILHLPKLKERSGESSSGKNGSVVPFSRN